MLNQHLADRDEPCPLCGYNLRNLQTDRCPECGRQLRLTVGLAEPAIGAWVTTLVGLLLPAGVGVLVILIVAVKAFTYGRLPTRSEIGSLPAPVVFMFVHVLGSLPLAVIVLWRRRWFVTQNCTIQRASGTTAWGAVAISVICLAYMINH